MDEDIAILIVDDVSTVRSFLHQTLMHLGIENVDEAANAAQCMSACANKEYDIIFLDIELPDGDGKDMIADINSQLPEANVLWSALTQQLIMLRTQLIKALRGLWLSRFRQRK